MIQIQQFFQYLHNNSLHRILCTRLKFLNLECLSKYQQDKVFQQLLLLGSNYFHCILQDQL